MSAVAVVAITLFVIESIATQQFPPAWPANAESSRIVSVYFDSQHKIISTNAKTVGEALGRMGADIAADDLVEPSRETLLPDGFFNINVYRARPIVIEDGGKIVHTRSAHQSPRLVAAKAGLTIYPEDELVVSKVNNFVGDASIGERISVKRAVAITLVADGQSRELRTQATTVQTLIDDKAIPMGLKDSTSPAMDAALSPGMVITITRVSDAVVTQTESLPKPVRTISDATMLKGYQKVQAEGADGHRKVTYHINYHNGVEVARATIKVEEHVDPIERVVVVGTKVIYANNVEQWRDLVAKYFPEDVDYALAIMQCESRGNPLAVNYNNNGSVDRGLLQVNSVHKARVGGNVESLFEPETNLRVAREIWNSSGWGAWSCSRRI